MKACENHPPSRAYRTTYSLALTVQACLDENSSRSLFNKLYNSAYHPDRQNSFRHDPYEHKMGSELLYMRRLQALEDSLLSLNNSFS